MLVRLRQDWFGPDAVLRTRSKFPQHVPDDLRGVLPPFAEIVDANGEPVPDEEPVAPSSLRDFDDARAAAAAEDALRAKAEAFRAQTQKKR